MKKKDPKIEPDAVSKEVSDAAKAFSQLKPKSSKTGLWNLPKPDSVQQKQPKPPESASSLESPVPFITVTESSFDKNANANLDKKKTTNSSSSGFKTGQSSIHFSDVVMSSLPSQVSLELCPFSFVFFILSKNVSKNPILYVFRCQKCPRIRRLRFAFI